MKKTNKKKEKKIRSIRFRIAESLSIFCLVLLGLIVLFQMILLEPMYEASKTDAVIQVADEVADELESSELTEYIYTIQQQTDTCIMVYSTDTGGWNFEASNNMGCLLYRLPPQSLGSLISAAGSSADGSYLYKQNTENFLDDSGNDQFLNIIYTKIVSSGSNDAVIMVSAGVSPISATLSTLKKQLMWICLFMIIAVSVLTAFLYRVIAKPLAGITESTKTLPEGRYDEDPSTNRYQEARTLNLALTQAAQDIQKAEKAKRDLISNVSHDLRTPLTMISGYGEMMIDLPEEKTDENIQVIVDESKRLNALVNDLLDLSKLQDNRIVLKYDEFNFCEMLREQMKKFEVYQFREGFVIEQDIPDDVIVSGDAGRLQQVFNNFMTNAINYSGERKHIIVRETVENGHVTVAVRDFGEGIEEKDLPNIWDRYYKVDKTHVRVSSGSGIGLAICREILKLHNADYGVESKPGEGSTFRFSMPVVRTESRK